MSVISIFYLFHFFVTILSYISEQVCKLFSDVEVVCSVAHYAVLYWRNHSPLGRNLLLKIFENLYFTMQW